MFISNLWLDRSLPLPILSLPLRADGGRLRLVLLLLHSLHVHAVGRLPHHLLLHLLRQVGQHLVMDDAKMPYVVVLPPEKKDRLYFFVDKLVIRNNDHHRGQLD